MTYSVYQHWDPLKVCIVGKSYPPEFYSFITNSRVRRVMERIAYETEEDYQKLIKLLESFGVEVLRPTLDRTSEEYIDINPGRIPAPPMTPRDYSIMLGQDFFFEPLLPIDRITDFWELSKGSDWPDFKTLDKVIINTLKNEKPLVYKEINQWLAQDYNINSLDDLLEIDVTSTSVCKFKVPNDSFWSNVINNISNHSSVHSSVLPDLHLNAASTTRVGRDVYVGTHYYNQNRSADAEILKQHYPEYRWHVIDTGGHADGTFCPVTPGLIISLRDIPTYRDTFPGWEVVYLPGQSWDMVQPFLDLKYKNSGKWWVPGEELNDEFTEFVEGWLNHWVGYVEETVFDVNMLVIDEKNVVVNNYNEQVFRAFERYGITPHIINFRHRYFWDGGLHCITSDVHREGTMKDYFPERG